MESVHRITVSEIEGAFEGHWVWSNFVDQESETLRDLVSEPDTKATQRQNPRKICSLVV